MGCFDENEMMIVFLCTVFFIHLIIGLYLVLVYFKQNKLANNSLISEVSIIIPFKNESDRIRELLDCINRLHETTKLVVEFIFVDDGSSDNSAQIIGDNLKNAKIIANKGDGKKMAIKTAVEKAQFAYILSWDADISMKENYLNELAQLPQSDMWILPVRLTGNKLIQRLGSIEYSWFQLIGLSMAKKQSAFLCSGANLLFKKSMFLKAEEHRIDYGLPSGDDYFLLKVFKIMGAQINASTTEKLLVKSNGPDSYILLMAQRKRWIAKTKGQASVIEFILSVIQLFFVGCFLTALFNIQLGIVVLLPIGLKFVNEYLFLQFERRWKQPTSDSGIVLIHQLWYPCYLIILLLPFTVVEKRWRKLKDE